LYLILFSSLYCARSGRVSLAENMRGINIFDLNGQALGSPQVLEDELSQIKAIGANYVVVDFLIYQQNATSTRIYEKQGVTPSTDNITLFVNTAHRKNLSVMLKPIVVCDEGNCTMVTLNPSNITGWFQSYKAYITSLARLAESLRVEVLSVALELVLISHKYHEEWVDLIACVRKEFTGLLTYCSVFYPEETGNVTFWSSLDFISMDTYVPFYNVTSQQQMNDDYYGYLTYVMSWLMTQPQNVSSLPMVLSEVGYPSSLSGLTMPWATIPEGKCPSEGMGASNFTAQDMAWKAVLSTVVAFPKIKGTVVFWYDNPSTPDWYPDRNNDNWACDWTPRGKPAECTIARAWNGTASIAKCGQNEC